GTVTALTSLTTDAAGTTQLNGGAVTTSLGQTYGDNVTLGVNTILTSTTSGNIDLKGTVNGTTVGGQSLTVNTSGQTFFRSTVGSGTSLASVTTDAPGSTTLTGSVTTSGAQSYGDPVTLAATSVLTSTANAA